MIRPSAAGCSGVQAVARAGGVEVGVLLVVDEPVVGAVVEPLEGQRRAHVVALGGVVVDHVEDHLEAGGVQRLHERLELGDLAARRRRRSCTRRSGRRTRWCCSPSSSTGPLSVSVESCTNWCTGSSSTDVMPRSTRCCDRLRVREARVRALDLLRDARHPLREALHMGLVDDRLLERHARRGHASSPQSNDAVDDDAAGHRGRGVGVVALAAARSCRARTAAGRTCSRPRSRARAGRAAACGRCGGGPFSGSHGPSTRRPYRVPTLDARARSRARRSRCGSAAPSASRPSPSKAQKNTSLADSE